MIAILWANEVFDKKKPDTISSVIEMKKLKVVTVVELVLRL